MNGTCEAKATHLMCSSWTSLHIMPTFPAPEDTPVCSHRSMFVGVGGEFLEVVFFSSYQLPLGSLAELAFVKLLQCGHLPLGMLNSFFV